ncbi:MAG: hypothetical protein M3418_06590, partial [Gemmatimonadota bacterium]|nr:hypothetical protein [Gemmatimonadota bacterium]
LANQQWRIAPTTVDANLASMGHWEAQQRAAVTPVMRYIRALERVYRNPAQAANAFEKYIKTKGETIALKILAEMPGILGRLRDEVIAGAWDRAESAAQAARTMLDDRALSRSTAHTPTRAAGATPGPALRVVQETPSADPTPPAPDLKITRSPDTAPDPGALTEAIPPARAQDKTVAPQAESPQQGAPEVRINTPDAPLAPQLERTKEVQQPLRPEPPREAPLPAPSAPAASPETAAFAEVRTRIGEMEQLRALQSESARWQSSYQDNTQRVRELSQGAPAAERGIYQHGGREAWDRYVTTSAEKLGMPRNPAPTPRQVLEKAQTEMDRGWARLVEISREARHLSPRCKPADLLKAYERLAPAEQQLARQQMPTLEKRILDAIGEQTRNRGLGL